MNLYGKSWPYFPITAFVFAYDSIRLDALGDALLDLQGEAKPWHRIDAIWVLKRGYLANTSPGTMDFILTPTQDSSLIAIRDKALLHMVVHLQTLLQYAWQPGFKLLDYLISSEFGTPIARWNRDDSIPP